MVAVADRRLRHLRDQRLRVAQQQVQHGRTLELFPDSSGVEPKTLSGALHNRPAGGGLTTHKKRDTDDALVPHHGNFGRRAVFHDVQQRHDGCGREIHMR